MVDIIIIMIYDMIYILFWRTLNLPKVKSYTKCKFMKNIRNEVLLRLLHRIKQQMNCQSTCLHVLVMLLKYISTNFYFHL